MSKVLIIAEHLNGKLNCSTARCVTCARDLKPDAIDVLVLADAPDAIAAEAAKIEGVTKVLTAANAANAHALAAIYAPQIAAVAKKDGLQQFLHNETFENSRTIDGRLTYPLLLQALDPDLVKMQFQMSSMQTIGNPITYFRLYPGRFISAHVHGVDLSTRPAARGMAMPVTPDPNATPRGAGAGGGNAGRVALAIGDDSVNWPAVFTAAKEGGLKNYFIEQEAQAGWDAMLKGIAYLKTLS